MNCPFHIEMYKTKRRSYRDLPFRWAELGTVYRYESAGTLHGLMRVRGFTQDDAHLFLRPDQLDEEIERCVRFVLVDAEGVRVRGVRSDAVDAAGEVRRRGRGQWEVGHRGAASVRDQEARLPFEIDEGGGAFYGPKIDVKIKDSLGRYWQCSTVQAGLQPARAVRHDLHRQGRHEDPAGHDPPRAARLARTVLRRSWSSTTVVRSRSGWLRYRSPWCLGGGTSRGTGEADRQNTLTEQGYRVETDIGRRQDRRQDPHPPVDPEDPV